MARIEAITNDAEMYEAMARVDEIFKKWPDILEEGPGNPDYAELTFLTDLVLDYEDEHYPIEPPTPAQSIRVRLEDSGLTPNALIPCIGSRDAVAEVLAGQREVTPEMAQALYERLNIDVRDLLGQPTTPATG